MELYNQTLSFTETIIFCSDCFWFESLFMCFVFNYNIYFIKEHLFSATLIKSCFIPFVAWCRIVASVSSLHLLYLLLNFIWKRIFIWSIKKWWSWWRRYELILPIQKLPVHSQIGLILIYRQLLYQEGVHVQIWIALVTTEAVAAAVKLSHWIITYPYKSWFSPYRRDIVPRL